jgi:D-lactate dehydrogenase
MKPHAIFETIQSSAFFNLKNHCMNVIVYSTHKFEKEFLLHANADKHNLKFVDIRLDSNTAYLAQNVKAVSIFVNDDASAGVLEILKKAGVQFLILRSAGHNNVNVEIATQLGIKIARVPAYSPYAVAEHAIALMLALNRKLIRASNRVHELNFSLDGLTGFDMNGKTAGIIGTGQIGSVVAKILHGFGCNILAIDQIQNEELKSKYEVEYTDYDTIYNRSDIITLHVPLLPETRYLINQSSIAKMKPGVMLINTSRGALVNTKDVITGLKSCHIGYFGMDVYEEEAGLFFEDHSEDMVQDDVITRLLSFRNVLITSHQAFLTQTALQNIADTTVYNLDCFERSVECRNEVRK